MRPSPENKISTDGFRDPSFGSPHHTSLHNERQRQGQTQTHATDNDHADGYNQDNEDDISYDPSMNSAGMSVDSKDVKYESNLSTSVKTGMSDGVFRFLAQWRILLLGQLLSVLLACSGAFSASMHFNCNISAPTMQTALVFLLMSFHLFPFMINTRKRRKLEKLNRNDDKNKNTDSSGFPAMEDIALGRSTSVDSSLDVYNRNSKNSPEQSQIQVPRSHSLCCGLISLNAPWWAYAIFACILVQASFFTYLALKFTTLPSASLLDNTNIFAAMVGSRLILKRRYSATHILGAIICCMGVFFNLSSDYEKAGEDATMVDDITEKIEDEEYPKRMLGDALAVLGGLLVGFCDVFIELIVKDLVSVNEYLGCVGIFGTIIACIQAFVLERSQIAKIFSSDSANILTTQEVYESYTEDPFNAPRSCRQSTAIGLVAGYVVSAYLFNYCMTRFLAKSESALLTLSLLTADLYSVIFTVIAENMTPTFLFYFAFIFVIVGVIVYEMAPSPLGHTEDLIMNKGIVLDREKMQEMSNLSLQVSFASRDGDSVHKNIDIERREIL